MGRQRHRERASLSEADGLDRAATVLTLWAGHLRYCKQNIGDISLAFEAAAKTFRGMAAGEDTDRVRMHVCPRCGETF